MTTIETADATGAVHAIGVFQGREDSTDPTIFNDLSPASVALLDGAGFTGKLSQVVAVPHGEDQLLYLVGLGDEVDREQLRQAAGWLGGATLRVPDLTTSLHVVDIEGAEQAVAEGFLLAQYGFLDYQESETAGTDRLALVGGGQPGEWRSGEVVASSVNWARDLVNRSPRDKSPEMIVEQFKSLIADLPVALTVWDAEDLERERCGGLLGVNAGSVAPARMIIAEYAPSDAVQTLAIVGKGIVFDSGGLNLKTFEFMKTMKSDMAGAAATLAALRAIAALEVPTRVIVYVPLTENLPSGSATRPGDVLTARNGKTMEVLNTDAEGRLVLADGLSLAAEGDADLIVDIATLTGASHVALGHRYAGLWSNVDSAGAMVGAAASRAGERVWPMPLPADYRTAIESEIADVKNVGDRYGGAIHAALFLAEFAGEGPWAHLDIAGPAWGYDKAAYDQLGGTGFGVRTLVELARLMSEA